MAGTTKKGSAVHGQYKKEEYGRVHAYVDGTAVRRLDPVPEKVQKRPAPQISAETKQNRERALQMSVGYVLFLTAAAVVTVLTCVNYLQLQAKGTRLQTQVTALETQLDQAKLENDSNYNQIMADADSSAVSALAASKADVSTGSSNSSRSCCSAEFLAWLYTTMTSSIDPLA